MGLWTINTLIDFIFMIDIGVNFCTTYVNDAGEEIFDKKKIAKRYFKGQFWLDFIASIPLDNFLTLSGESNSFVEIMGLTDLLKLTRILRLGRIIKFNRSKDDVKGTMKLM